MLKQFKRQACYQYLALYQTVVSLPTTSRKSLAHSSVAPPARSHQRNHPSACTEAKRLASLPSPQRNHPASVVAQQRNHPARLVAQQRNHPASLVAQQRNHPSVCTEARKLPSPPRKLPSHQRKLPSHQRRL